ncbi:MAG TPA: aminodeoxychorismate/anthranilate synthase component II [Firmicutes bacterium]|nr:aminodeoxychorismate/anthranilate synthase component II [Bacillota bacterium]
MLVIDNYDSFTYNLVQLLGELGTDLLVFRNDEIDLPGIQALRPDALVISPGPGRPEQSGVTLEAVRTLAGRLPIFGVCLGLQAVTVAFGGRVGKARHLMHGKVSRIRHDGQGVFRGLPPEFTATRYHSLAAIREDLPGELMVSAEAEDGEIMGLRHRRYLVETVQFHPESILTPVGKDLLRNFLDLVREWQKREWSAHGKEMTA